MRKMNCAKRLTQWAAWYSDNFFWLVYLFFSLFVVAYALRNQPGCASAAYYLALPLPLGCIVALFLFTIETLTSRRWQIGLSLAGFAAFLTVTLGFAEFLLRRRLPPNLFQHHLQSIYERRNTEGKASYLGTSHLVSYNRFGWRDREHAFGRTPARRWVFIGDSYLEAAITPTLASVFEQRVQKRISDAEVVNLSKAGAAPEEEYQHFFYEWAFEYEPTDIVLFLCAANDFRSLEAAEYRHPSFFVASEVLAKVKREPDLGHYLPQLEKWARRKKVFLNREDFLSALGSGPRSQRQRVYQIALGFGAINKPGVLPNTREYVERGLGPSLGRIISFAWDNFGYREAQAASYGGCPVTDEEVFNRYNEIYSQPLSSRLAALAKWAAASACRSVDWKEYLTVLQSYPKYFRDDVVRFPHDAGYWERALHVTVERMLTGREQRMREPQPDGIQEAKYEGLISRMHAYAAARNVRFTVVLIPEAHPADRTFAKYWDPVVKAWTPRGDAMAMRNAMAVRLPAAGIPTLDLISRPQVMDGAYLIFNGHWSEPGIQRIAQWLADFMGV